MRYCPSCGARFSQEAAFCPHDGIATEALPQVPETDPLLGTVIDERYQVESKLGEGGMGIVYLATHRVLGKKLALKVLRGEMARDAEVVRRFVQEAQTASSIGHPNIVDIHDFGRLPDGAVYFVMEHLDGESLSDLIAQGGSVPMGEAVAIIRQIASALGAAHARGIVHRDLKPDNVMVLRRGGEPVVKVLDFGIAKVGGAGAKITRTGVVFGTPHYMSPEQAAGQTVDGRTDIYALGVIMYEMFTGKVPFDADTFMGILSKHMFEPPLRPSELGANQSLGSIEAVILRALAKKPEDRYADMAAVLADLSRVQTAGEMAVGGRPGLPVPSGLAGEPSTVPRNTPNPRSTTSALPQRRGPLLALAGMGVAVLAVGVVGGVFALRGDGEQEPPQSTGVAELPGEPESPLTPPGADGPGAPADALPGGMEPPEAPAEVEVTSTPAGAKLFVEGALVGNTPVRVPRPGAGEAHHAVLRHRGYEDKPVELTATSPDTVDLALEPVRRETPRVTRRPSPRPAPQRAPEPAEARQEPAPEPKPKHRPFPPVTQEVVDPWAD